MNQKLNTFFILFFTIPILFGALIGISILYGYLNPKETALEADTSVENAVLAETEDLGQAYVDKIIFLGESTTYGLQRYGVLSGGEETKQVWTGAALTNGRTVCTGTLSLSPSIDSTKIFYPDTGSPMTIHEALSIKKPELLVITLGLNNGASYYSEQSFKDCYRKLLDSAKGASTDTSIILQSLFPVSKSCQIKAYTPERIALCNDWIYDIALEYGLKYLNTAEVLADDRGYLKAEFDNGGDGIHLNRDGLYAVINYIRTHGLINEKACYKNAYVESVEEIEKIFFDNLKSEFGYCDVSDYYRSNYFGGLCGIKECKIYTSNESTNFDEFGIMLFDNEKNAKKAKKTVNNYLANAKEEFRSGIIYNVAEYPKFEAARLELYGNYLIYGILDGDILNKILTQIRKI